jgi:hypothetical protein
MKLVWAREDVDVQGKREVGGYVEAERYQEKI